MRADQWETFFVLLLGAVIFYTVGKILDRYNIEDNILGMRRVKVGAKVFFFAAIGYLILGLLGLADFLDNISK